MGGYGLITEIQFSYYILVREMRDYFILTNKSLACFIFSNNSNLSSTDYF